MTPGLTENWVQMLRVGGCKGGVGMRYLGMTRLLTPWWRRLASRVMHLQFDDPVEQQQAPLLQLLLVGGILIWLPMLPLTIISG